MALNTSIIPPSLEGGLFQISSLSSGATQFAFKLMDTWLRDDKDLGPCLWVSDNSSPYPGAMMASFSMLLSRLICVRPPQPQEVWSVGLEAIQSGLFRGVFLRPSKACSISHLRRLQLASEKTKTAVFLLGKIQISRWMMKNCWSVSGEKVHATNSLFAEPRLFHKSGGSLPLPYAARESYSRTLALS